LPYRGEYAKSGRASCKACKSTIDKGDLRLAAMVQSPMFDGKTPHWYHPKCFFTRNRPKAVGDIAHYDSLRWEDQEKIQKMMTDALSGKPLSGKGKSAMTKSGTNMGDFRLEYAKSGASKCGVCEEKIKKNEVRAGKKEYESQRAKMYGPYDKWHHLDCFVKDRDKLEFFDGGDKMAGFHTLSADDQAMVKDKIKATKRKCPADCADGGAAASNGGSGGPSAKKIKKEENGGDNKDANEEMKKQNKKIFYYRDNLERSLKKAELQDMLSYNKQEIPSGPDRMLDRLADIMTFGALEPCPECKEGQLVYRSGVGYQCMGNISEWTKCQYKTLKPARREFKVPKELKECHSFLKMYGGKVRERLIPNIVSSVQPQANGAASANGVKSELKAEPGVVKRTLKGVTFILDGKVDKETLKQLIEKHGGKVGSRMSGKVAAVISTPDQLSKGSKVIDKAEESKIHVVSEDVLDGFPEESITTLIKRKQISDWGSDLSSRVPREESANKIGSGSGASSMFMKKEMPKSVVMKLKGGGFVDPDSNLEHKAHVLKVRDALYSVVLGSVNIQEGKNSFYKLQVLEHDKKSKWYVFRSWGRVGTTIGGTKLEDFSERNAAMENFQFLYEEKTGNRWSARNNFKKQPNKMYPLDLDYGQDNEALNKQLSVANSKSKLDKAVKELVALIFDIESMKKAMVEFEIDLTKMPLGKLSRKQIEKAYAILSEVQTMVTKGRGSVGSETKFLDASNRFFTLIPHDFGMASPPILNNEADIKAKLDMLESLLEIEVAYNLLKSSDNEIRQREKEGGQEKDPIDAHYEKLKTSIEVLDKETEEFKTLEKYVRNTHASTHTQYTLEIEDIFKIERKGEAKRFKPFKKMHNRQLLWHGSRTTNYAGILSQGLRIAPPEAPVTGYMFGKGVYFADMVSKSANYCATTRTNNTGLLLLCDVALGEMYERSQADYIEKLPVGKNSCKGVGKTAPDPADFAEMDGARVPLGKGQKNQGVDSALLYNEYIVYDVAQVQSKYLFKMKFNYV